MGHLVTDGLLHTLPTSPRDQGTKDPRGPAWPPEVSVPQSTGHRLPSLNRPVEVLLWIGQIPIARVIPLLGWDGHGPHHRGESSAGLGWAWAPSQGESSTGLGWAWAPSQG